MKYPPNHFLGAQRNGLNHVGMEIGTIGNRNFGPIRDRHLGGAEYPVYSDELLNTVATPSLAPPGWYVTKNVKSVRLMFTWEAVQRTLMGDVPATASGVGYGEYWEDLTDVLNRLLTSGIYVILCPLQHNSMSDNTDMVYDDKAFYLDHNAPGKPFTSKFFANFWGKFAKAINDATKAVPNNQQLIAFDLINEPHLTLGGNDVGILLDQWFTCAQDAITAIRATGATNTIFVPGMDFADAESFTTNGSSAAWLKHPVTKLPLTDPLTNIAVTVHCYSGVTKRPGGARQVKPVTALRDACSLLVTWARDHDKKVNIGEIALDAGQNRSGKNGDGLKEDGTPNYCTESDRAYAEKQWDVWNTFCRENNDVLVGWNWWSNGEGGWLSEEDSCGENPNHWALTRDNGKTQTVYMDLIEDTLAPILRIQDNVADTGSEPNNTTSLGYESTDVWVTQPPSPVPGIRGGEASTVHVKVTNNGKGLFPPPSGGGYEVRLYWAKADSALNWPEPWNGKTPKLGGIVELGGEITPAKPIFGPIQPKLSETVTFPWTTRKPEDYPVKDGHFCLLAFVTRITLPEWEGFREGVILNDNVLKLSNVAWRNIHIVLPGPMMKIGHVVVANHMGHNMLAQIAFEILDAEARPVDPAGARLLITPKGDALEKLREHQGDRPFLEDLGDGTFRVLDLATGIPHLDLRPEEVLPFELEYIPEQEAKGYVVRAIQFSLEDASRKVIGGQTFVAGEVEGFTTRPEPRHRRSWWPWVTISVLLLLLIALLVKGRKKK